MDLELLGATKAIDGGCSHGLRNAWHRSDLRVVAKMLRELAKSMRLKEVASARCALRPTIQGTFALLLERQSHGIFGAGSAQDRIRLPRELPGGEPDDALAELERESDLRGCAGLAPHGYDGIRRANDQAVAELAQSGGDGDREMRIRGATFAAGQDAHREPTFAACSAAGRFHHAGETSADDHRAGARKEGSDLLGCGRLLRRAGPASHDGDIALHAARLQGQAYRRHT